VCGWEILLERQWHQKLPIPSISFDSTAIFVNLCRGDLVLWIMKFCWCLFNGVPDFCSQIWPWNQNWWSESGVFGVIFFLTVLPIHTYQQCRRLAHSTAILLSTKVEGFWSCDYQILLVAIQSSPWLWFTEMAVESKLLEGIGSFWCHSLRFWPVWEWLS